MRAIRCMTGMLLLTVACLSAGCELARSQTWLFPESKSQATSDEQKQRTKFQTEQSSEAVRWLLSHRVRQGMSQQDVALIIGEDGAPVDADAWIKNDASSGYQVGDETCRWGPDDKGNSYYLVFREGKLVNFDPAEFRDMTP
jgi:hypothetical protein